MKIRNVMFVTIISLLVILFCGCGKNDTDTMVDITYNDLSKDDSFKDEAEEANYSLESSTYVENMSISENEITVIMVGDMLLHDRIEKYARMDDGSYEYSAIFEHVKDDIESADLAIANQEVMIGGEELGVSGYPSFNAPYSFADELAKTGFDVICQGSNHALDKGGKGIVNCLSYWENHYPDIGVLGIHDSKEDQDEIYVWESEDTNIKIAILNYTYGTNGIKLPDNMPYAVDYLSEERVISDLNRAEELADFTIVCPHWGEEYSLEVSSFQQKWAKLFVENGADLIIGTHPHVIEPIEVVMDEQNKNTIPIYYSIGNFVNWTSGTGSGVSNRMVGGMARIVLNCTKEGVYVKENDVIPLVSHVTSKENGVTVYRLDDYTKELAEENEINNQTTDFSLDYCKQLVEKVWGISE